MRYRGIIFHLSLHGQPLCPASTRYRHAWTAGQWHPSPEIVCRKCMRVLLSRSYVREPSAAHQPPSPRSGRYT